RGTAWQFRIPKDTKTVSVPSVPSVQAQISQSQTDSADSNDSISQRRDSTAEIQEKPTRELGLQTIRQLANDSQDKTFTKLGVIQVLVAEGVNREKAEKFWLDAYKSGIIYEVRLGEYKKA
ncbi:MAG: hypothetical protein ACRDF4_09235, partial [Rhabdochlamydiaceae bacterium]